MARTRHETYPRTDTGTQQGARSMTTAMTKPNLVSLVIALGVIGLAVVMFPLDWVRAPEVTVTTERSVFAPGGNGGQVEVAAFYTLSEPAKITAAVRNSAGQVIRTLMKDQPRGDGQHGVSWDGRNDAGQIVPDGLYRIVVTAAGTARTSEHSTPVEIDTTPPKLQLANFPEDLTTRESTLKIEGSTEPNTMVYVSGQPQPVSVDSRGVFRLSRVLDEGMNPIDIRAVDAAGNETLVSRMVTLRTEPPDLKLLAPEENNLFVSNNMITVKGRVPPDVSVAVNGREATVNEQGLFSLDMVLDEGENLLTVRAVDSVGNESRMERLVTLRSEGPTITLNNLPEGLVVDEAALQASGKVEPGTKLEVNGKTVPVDANGNFSTMVLLQGGSNLLTITASDVAGNSTSVQRTVVYESRSAESTPLPRFTIPNNWDNPLLLRLLIGVGLIGGAFFLFSRLVTPIAFDLTVDYPVFYPNRPTDQRMLVMRLHLSRAAKIDIDIYDEFNRHVLKLVEGRKQGEGEHFRLWDGRNRASQVLPEGSYLIQATCRTATNTATSAVWVRLDPSYNGLVGTSHTQAGWVEEEQMIDIN